MCCPGKKDAEGWETVQRGRTAKPRSAAIVAKVSPVLAHVVPKQDRANDNQSQLPPQEEQQLRPQCPLDKDATKMDTDQQVPAEPQPLEEVGRPESGNMMEVLRFRTLWRLSPRAVPGYQLFTRNRVTLDHFISRIVFVLGSMIFIDRLSRQAYQL